ncbi:MAG TPA: epoxide hydrolase [Propionibacteriaceae bacterium]|nr:epoxide hydrolase [Propionibacteriaceae bacterium]
MDPHDARPFQVAVPEEHLLDLRRRLVETRWPEPATVRDWSQGVPLHDLQRLCRYWLTEYDWRPAEQRLNRWPQYLTDIDGLTIHYFRLASSSPSAVPLVLTHGWPGSFFEFEQAMERLAESDFDLVVPSLPGYGFSGKPAGQGWGVHRIAQAWAELMQRLGYQRFIAGGSDWGTSVSTSLALHYPDQLLGLHLIPPLVPLSPAGDPAPTPQERKAAQELSERGQTGSGYSAMHGTRPQTIGYSLLDSPVGLCAWILEKLWAWSDHAGDLYHVLSQDQVLDNITLYWLTGTGASSARLYWESIAEISTWFTDTIKDSIDVPTGCTIFPREVPRPSRWLAERRFRNIVYWSEPAHGGHFGAWEQADLFVQEVQAVRRAVTQPVS